MLVQNLRSVRVPGTVWVAVFVLAGALLQQYLGHDAMLYQAGLVLLAALAKLVDINFDQVLAVLQSVDKEKGQPVARGESALLAPLRVEEDETPPTVEEHWSSKGIRLLFG